jgi:hypothetical protein
MSELAAEPIIAEFVLLMRAFQEAYKLSDLEMLGVVSETAEVLKRSIHLKRKTKELSPNAVAIED